MSLWGVSLQLLGCSPAHSLIERNTSSARALLGLGDGSFLECLLAGCYSRIPNMYKQASQLWRHCLPVLWALHPALPAPSPGPPLS